MSSSSLVNWKWTGTTDHYNVRDHSIDRLTIHMMAGNGSLQTCFDWLAYHSGGSVNYGIDSTGKIGLMIDESLRAWTSSNRANDMRAVTVEVANDSGAPTWHVSDKAMASLIKLCADICKRNGIKALNYTGDKTCQTGNMSLHKWFTATDCPGQYLESKMTYIANEVNKILNGGVTPSVTYKTYYANDKSGVNYRKTPNGVLMGTYKYGEAVSVAVGSDTVNSGTTWVQAKNGYWSAKNLLSTTKPVTTTYKIYYANDPTGVNYRKTPNGEFVGTYPYGQAVELAVESDVVSGGTTWVQAKNGYWSAKNLFSTVQPKSLYPYQSGKTYTLQADMKVRDGASTSNPQIKTSKLTADEKKIAYNQTYAVLKKGSKITLRGVVRRSDKEYWGKIGSGYVCLMTASKTYAK